MTIANAIVTSPLVVDYHTERGLVRALAHDGLRIEAGASVAIMGPSGCGKSTLLGLLAGLAVPSQGTVTIGSTAISELSDQARVRFRRKTIGMVYQADNLLPHLTVEENVGLQFAISRGDADHSDANIGTEVHQLLEMLGVGELATRLPDQLSGGQRQRVALARAVVHRPAVILADEPTGALDEASATRVIDLLFDVQSQIGATLVLVTHDRSVASHADWIEELVAPLTTDKIGGSHAR